jgi:DNA-binding transcriptional MerR regulator
MSRETYTIGDVARICRFSIAAVRKLADAGVISSWKIPHVGSHGGHRRFNREDILDFGIRCKLSHVLDYFKNEDNGTHRNGIDQRGKQNDRL